MNREIKFRAMTKKNNLMVYGDLIFTPNKDHRIIWFKLKGKNGDYNDFNEVVQTSTIGQFTGLHDKNGKEIYEGDIVMPFSLDYKYDKSVIVYEFNQFRIKGKNLYWNFDLQQIEVIGNIYENPELL